MRRTCGCFGADEAIDLLRPAVLGDDMRTRDGHEGDVDDRRLWFLVVGRSSSAEDGCAPPGNIGGKMMCLLVTRLWHQARSVVMVEVEVVVCRVQSTRSGQCE